MENIREKKISWRFQCPLWTVAVVATLSWKIMFITCVSRGKRFKMSGNYQSAIQGTQDTITKPLPIIHLLQFLLICGCLYDCYMIWVWFVWFMWFVPLWWQSFLVELLQFRIYLLWKKKSTIGNDFLDEKRVPTCREIRCNCIFIWRHHHLQRAICSYSRWCWWFVGKFNIIFLWLLQSQSEQSEEKFGKNEQKNGFRSPDLWKIHPMKGSC